MPMDNKLYSVVIPVFNSSDIVSQTVHGVREFFIGKKLDFEIILVNDGSRDDSWDVIKGLALAHGEVRAVDLLKNYGQHHANLCGFHLAKGEYVITMDDDMQNPPEEIEKLIDSVGTGHDVVIGRYVQKHHSLFRRLGSRLVGWLNRIVFDVKGQLVLSNFRIVHRSVVDRICSQRHSTPYIPGLILKYASSCANVWVEHKDRKLGHSGYGIRKIAGLVATILFQHSTIPLRLCAIFGFLTAFICFGIGMVVLINALVRGTASPGWPSIVVLFSFFNGILLLFLSIIGEYIIRIQRDVSGSRGYEIREIAGR